MKLVRSVMFSICFTMFYILLNGFKINHKICLVYQDIFKSYLNNNLDNSVTFYYNLTSTAIRKGLYDDYYDFSFELKGIVTDYGKSKPEFPEIITMIIRGFRVSFIVDRNLNFVYHPDIQYFYFDDPLYKKYKDRIDEKIFRDFSKSLFYNFYDWFGKLRKRGYIDVIKFGFYVNYNVYYEGVTSNVYLPLGKRKYKADLLTVKANILNVDFDNNFFYGMKLINGSISSYEYYEYDSCIPLLLQRELLMKFEIIDPNIRQQYFEKYKKYDVEYRILKTMILLYKN